MTLYLGIDNGRNGAFVLIDEYGNIVSNTIMPFDKENKEYDLFEIEGILKQYQNRDIEIFLEEGFYRYGIQSQANFGLGYSLGMMKAMLFSLKLKYQLVKPREWQKEMFKGYTEKDKDKCQEIYCLDECKYEKELFLATERSKVCHTGLTAATCIANYGLKISKREV